MKNYIYLITFCSGICIITSCQKNWLDAKPNKALVVPSTFQNYQALLDNTSTMFNINEPALQDVASDDLNLTYALWSSQSALERLVYTWSADNIYQGGPNLQDWAIAYQRIFNANTVLDGIQSVAQNAGDEENWNNVKGSALFFRAFDFFNLAQLFCKPYIATSAATDLGIPVKLSSNINEKTTRSTVQQTYTQIINDLVAAKGLLPDLPPVSAKTRPSKVAVYGLLARVYLSMGDYNKAFTYSDNCLQLQSTLMDYNALNKTAASPFPKFNSEVIFSAQCIAYFSVVLRGTVESTLIAQYAPNDLRRTLSMSPTGSIYGRNYTGGLYPFCGIAVDEELLIRSECNARTGNVSNAMNDLNTLLKARWVTGTFVPYTAASSDDALSQILKERRKELIFRGLRWTDLRRLNQDPKYAKTLTRVLNGQTYTLPPNDPRYVFPIPPNEIQLSGIPQNPR